MTIDRKEVLTDIRLAGQVVRYHTWPTHQRQTVADHSWNVLRIYQQIWVLTVPVTVYILYHDCGEIKLGDLPFPVKQTDVDFKLICERIERVALKDMEIELPQLSAVEKKQVKIADLIEMHEFGLMEIRLGNVYADPIVRDTWSAVCDLINTFEPIEQKPMVSYLRKRSTRCL